MVELKQKIKAFTIMESMVSIVIVMIVFSLASVVIINITSSGMSREKQNAYVLVNIIRNEAIQAHRFIDETFEKEDLVVEKKILAYGTSSELKILLIEAFKNKKKLVESKEIVVLKTE